MVKHLAFAAISINGSNPHALEEIRRRLSGIEGIRFAMEGEAIILSHKAMQGMDDEVVIRIPGDDSLRYVLVDKVGSFEGRDLSGCEAEELQKCSACVEMYATFPRASRYSVPYFAVDEDVAMTIAGKHFPVACNFFSSSRDSGDNSATEIWLRLKVRRAHCSAPATISFPCGSLGEEV